MSMVQRAQTVPSSGGSGQQLLGQDECRTCAEEKKVLLESHRIIQELSRKLKEEEERNNMLQTEIKRATKAYNDSKLNLNFRLKLVESRSQALEAHSDDDKKVAELKQKLEEKQKMIDSL